MSSCSFVARNNSEKSLCVRVTAFIFNCLLMYWEVNSQNYLIKSIAVFGDPFVNGIGKSDR